MSKPSLKVPIAHIETGIKAVRKKNDNEGYDDLILATHASYERGKNPDAPLVPYVQFVLDATLASLARHNPRIDGKDEVRNRAELAGTYARAIDRYTFEHNPKDPLFARIYGDYPILSEMMFENPEISHAFMTGRTYMSSLVSSPFSDVSMSVGGVVRFLKQRHNIENRKARSIALASELPLVGTIPKSLGRQAVQTLLRDGPYIDPSRFTLDGNVVVFNPETRAYITSLSKKVKGSGCPADRIRYQEGSGAKNVMRRSWAQIADYLVTKSPTAEATQ
jgi:hypothetical protein